MIITQYKHCHSVIWAVKVSAMSTWEGCLPLGQNGDKREVWQIQSLSVIFCHIDAGTEPQKPQEYTLINIYFCSCICRLADTSANQSWALQNLLNWWYCGSWQGFLTSTRGLNGLCSKSHFSSNSRLLSLLLYPVGQSKSHTQPRFFIWEKIYIYWEKMHSVYKQL